MESAQNNEALLENFIRNTVPVRSVMGRAPNTWQRIDFVFIAVRAAASLNLNAFSALTAELLGKGCLAPFGSLYSLMRLPLRYGTG
jgi:hypothetical protein